MIPCEEPFRERATNAGAGASENKIHTRAKRESRNQCKPRNTRNPRKDGLSSEHRDNFRSFRKSALGALIPSDAFDFVYSEYFVVHSVRFR